MKRGELRGWRRGRLYAFMQDFEEYKSGPALYPVAIIEDRESRQVVVVGARLVSFSKEQPGPDVPDL
jgi:hypothetical protein